MHALIVPSYIPHEQCTHDNLRVSTIWRLLQIPVNTGRVTRVLLRKYAVYIGWLRHSFFSLIGLSGAVKMVYLVVLFAFLFYRAEGVTESEACRYLTNHLEELPHRIRTVKFSSKINHSISNHFNNSRAIRPQKLLRSYLSLFSCLLSSSTHSLTLSIPRIPEFDVYVT